jgi:hypothetical protein
MTQNITAEQNGTSTSTNNGNGTAKNHKADRRVFASEEEARKAGPVLATQKLFAMQAEGTTVYCWGRGAWQAYMSVAESRGWKVTRTDKPVSRDALAAGLAALSPEERAALLAQFAPTPAPSKTTTKKGGKGLFKPESPYAEAQ